jgi:hypothetical protein
MRRDSQAPSLTPTPNLVDNLISGYSFGDPLQKEKVRPLFAVLLCEVVLQAILRRRSPETDLP